MVKSDERAWDAVLSSVHQQRHLWLLRRALRTSGFSCIGKAESGDLWVIGSEVNQANFMTMLLK